jgi:hypothetical protein
MEFSDSESTINQCLNFVLIPAQDINPRHKSNTVQWDCRKKDLIAIKIPPIAHSPLYFPPLGTAGEVLFTKASLRTTKKMVFPECPVEK